MSITIAVGETWAYDGFPCKVVSIVPGAGGNKIELKSGNGDSMMVFAWQLASLGTKVIPVSVEVEED